MPEWGLILWSILALAALVFWIIALVSILRNDFKGTNDKLIWILVVIFMPMIGSILYFTIGRKDRLK
jgi:hypothetical protein